MAIQQSTTIPEVKDTIVMLRQLNADDKVREEAYYREKQLHDEASALGGAKREGFAEGKAVGCEEGREKERRAIIERLRKKGFSDEEIMDMIGEDYV